MKRICIAMGVYKKISKENFVLSVYKIKKIMYNAI